MLVHQLFRARAGGVCSVCLWFYLWHFSSLFKQAINLKCEYVTRTEWAGGDQSFQQLRTRGSPSEKASWWLCFKKYSYGLFVAPPQLKHQQPAERVQLSLTEVTVTFWPSPTQLCWICRSALPFWKLIGAREPSSATSWVIISADWNTEWYFQIASSLEGNVFLQQLLHPSAIYLNLVFTHAPKLEVFQWFDIVPTDVMGIITVFAGL